MRPLFYYGVKKNHKLSFRTKLLWPGGSILVALAGLGFIFKEDTDILFLFRFPFGILYFFVGLIVLALFIFYFNKEYHYLLINDTTIKWRFGLLNRPTTISLEDITHYSYNEQVQFFSKSGNSFSFPQKKIKLTRKKRN